MVEAKAEKQSARPPIRDLLRLANVLSEHPRRFNSGTISRVARHLLGKYRDPRKPLTLNVLQTEHDLSLLVALHPDWQGQSLARIFLKGGKDALELDRLWQLWLYNNEPERQVPRRKRHAAWVKKEAEIFDLTLEVYEEEPLRVWDPDKWAKIKTHPPYFYEPPPVKRLKFDSFGERLVFIVLDHYLDPGCRESWTEGTTVHVRTVGQKEIDFRPGHFYLEIHPHNGRDRLRRIPLHSLSDVRSWKEDGLRGSDVPDLPFFLIEKPAELYSVLVDPRVSPLLRPEIPQDYDQFKKTLTLAHRLAMIYDLKEQINQLASSL